MTQDPKNADLPINPLADVIPAASTEPGRAEQGPPPADFATRPHSGVPTPDGHGLHADEVAAMIGQGDDTDANTDLAGAEGLNIDTES